ncbi:hypothetical protein MRX96_051084 [Rhipicephalus microplus]
MNKNRSTPSDPCSYSDLGNPVSATSSKWNPSSTDATSCKRGRRTPLKVRMAPSPCVSEVSYNDAVRSSDLLQPHGMLFELLGNGDRRHGLLVRPVLGLHRRSL